MKKFVELIQRVHQERFSVVMNKIAAEKIPVAFLSLSPINNAIEMVNHLRGQGANINMLITIDPAPPCRIEKLISILFILVKFRQFILAPSIFL